MNEITGFGKILIVLGIVSIAAGLLFIFAGKIPWIGKLPGDIYIKKEHFTFYFPLGTSVLLSILISLILFFIGRRS
jgi:hypothetical protein